MPAKNFRKRRLEQDELGTESEDEDDRRMALEEVMFLQKQRERKTGISALPSAQSGNSGLVRSGDKAEGDGEKEDLVLQDTFAQETAVIVEDPNMLKYVDQELAKRRGKKIDSGEKEDKDPMDELYAIPEHLKASFPPFFKLFVKLEKLGEKKEFRGKFYAVDHWNRGNSTSHRIVNISKKLLHLTLDIPDGGLGTFLYKLRNIEETEAAKKILQEKRLTGRTKSESSIPSSYSADYFHRGRDYAEKLRKDKINEEDENKLSFNHLFASTCLLGMLLCYSFDKDEPGRRSSTKTYARMAFLARISPSFGFTARHSRIKLLRHKPGVLACCSFDEDEADRQRRTHIAGLKDCLQTGFLSVGGAAARPVEPAGALTGSASRGEWQQLAWA
ncbi:hypothetical protein M5K25_002079 [Dendrobium thyrsiflorum]|uniref:Uncharacterized protein n=1 Tax=Dendrobium thyrsiflorum TaxID=117978 RepID=A0ABD0W471_DENTH